MNTFSPVKIFRFDSRMIRSVFLSSILLYSSVIYQSLIPCHAHLPLSRLELSQSFYASRLFSPRSIARPSMIIDLPPGRLFYLAVPLFLLLPAVPPGSAGSPAAYTLATPLDQSLSLSLYSFLLSTAIDLTFSLPPTRRPYPFFPPRLLTQFTSFPHFSASLARALALAPFLFRSNLILLRLPVAGCRPGLPTRGSPPLLPPPPPPPPGVPCGSAQSRI